MAESKSAAAGGINDVLRIRDIIFGEQMQAYEEQFKRQKGMLEDLQAQIEALETKMQEQHQQAQGDTLAQIEALKETLLARIDRLAQEKTARADLGAMLIDLGERLQRD